MKRSIIFLTAILGACFLLVFLLFHEPSANAELVFEEDFLTTTAEPTLDEKDPVEVFEEDDLSTRAELREMEREQERVALDYEL